MMNPESKVCENCPMAAALAAAENLVNEAADHKAAKQALGGIAITRRALEAVSERLTCEGPSSPNGTLECMRRDAALQARGFAFYMWPQNQISIPLEGQPVVETPVSGEKAPGQYM